MRAAIEIKIDGQPLESAIADRILDVRVDDHLRMPDVAVVRISDPALEHVDKLPVKIGSVIQISLGAPEDGAKPTLLFDGAVVALEPEFGAKGVVIGVRAYDKGHVLHRTRRSQTYQDTTLGEIARKVGGAAGLDVGQIDDPGSTLPFVQQTNETDWEFLWRLAATADRHVDVGDGKLNLKKAGPTGSPLDLRWGETLDAFRPRVTGAGQVDEVEVRGYDPVQGQEVSGKAGTPDLSSKIGIKRDDVVSGLKGGRVVVSDRPVSSADEAEALAKSVAAKLANGYVEARGVSKGNPKLKAGVEVKVAGVGERFGGTYEVTTTTHVYRASGGYETRFECTGRSERSLIELTASPDRSAYARGIVLGVVSQSEDPEKLGRVRVKLPALSGDAEGWWAPVLVPNAGDARGAVMLPQPNDVVIVAFENGDPQRPYVLGSLWSKAGKPPDDMKTDGSLLIRSDHEIDIGAKEKITIKSDQDLILELKGKVEQKSDGSLKIEAQSISIKSSGSLELEGSSGLKLTCGGSKITLDSSSIALQSSMIRLG